MTNASKSKKIKVTFVLYEGENWSINISKPRSASMAIALAYQYYVKEDLSVHNVEDIKTEKTDSYL